MTTADQRLNTALDLLDKNNAHLNSFVQGDENTSITINNRTIDSLAKMTASITAGGIPSGSITTAKLASGAVSVAKLDTSLSRTYLACHHWQRGAGIDLEWE